MAGKRRQGSGMRSITLAPGFPRLVLRVPSFLVDAIRRRR